MFARPPIPVSSLFILRHCYLRFSHFEISFVQKPSLVLFARWFHDVSVPFFPTHRTCINNNLLLKYPTHHTPGSMYTTGGPPAHNNKDDESYFHLCIFLSIAQTETCLCFLHFKTEGKEPGKNASVPFSWVAPAGSWLTPWFLCGDGLFSFTPFVPCPLSFLLFFLSFCFFLCGGLWATSFFLTTKKAHRRSAGGVFSLPPFFP